VSNKFRNIVKQITGYHTGGTGAVVG